MPIKKSYTKIRIFLSWKFPNFYHLLSTAKFPLQIGALGIAMAFLVSIYNTHYSFGAAARAPTMTAPAMTAPDAAATTTAETVVVGNIPDTNSPVAIGKQISSDNTVVSTQSSPATSPDAASPEEAAPSLEDTLVKSEDALQEQVQKAELLLRTKEQQTQRLEARVARAKELLRASEKSEPESTLAPDVGILLQTADWLEQLPEDHYVAQVAAAIEQKILVDYAISKEFKDPLIIYPFKTNKDGELVFGLSTGLFIAQDDAMTELPILSELSDEHGVWVRKVSDIKNQLATLKRDRIVE